MNTNLDTRKNLMENLLNDRSHHIEFNGHLTNHNKHAVIALDRLDASNDRIQAYYEAYAEKTPYGYGLELARKSKYSINEDNWADFLGKRTSFSAYYDFFDQQERKLGKDALLKQYVPILAPGWVGSLTHATIHLGWALDIGSRCMMLEGLAYMAFSYVSCRPEKICYMMQKDNLLCQSSAMESLLNIASVWDKEQDAMCDTVEKRIADKESDVGLGIHPELIRSGLQYRIAKILGCGFPVVYASTVWMNGLDPSGIWSQLNYMVTLLYMVEPGNFLVLHFITSLHAMQEIAKYMDLKEEMDLIRFFWVGILSILFSRAHFPSVKMLKELDAKYDQLFDVDGVVQGDELWQFIIAEAIEEEEEHNPKMVYVLQKMWKASGHQSIFRIAATHFTTTPELPKSFEMAPIE